MEFALQDHHRMLAETAAKVGARFGLDYWRDKDANKEFGAEFWQAVCDAGLAGVALPEAYGGRASAC
ncbi:MAG: acyl-CoA dehydrogenase family protein [Alphaproteobacteria bacterium]